MQNNDITLIESKKGLFSVDFKAIWKYRDLAVLFVKRDLKNTYKQTILGPVWIAISPLLSTSVFTIIFSVIAGISTESIPPFLFYMAGNILWTFFSNCLNKGAGTFLSNARIYGKVYFPRLITPVSGIAYELISFLVTWVVFIVLLIIFIITGAPVRPNWVIALTPLLVLQSGLLGMGIGLIVSSITTKYRDLKILVSFSVSLLMYITPVVYPVSKVPESFRWIMLINPVAPIVETYRYAFLGSGAFHWVFWLISLGVTALVVFFGVVVFNKVERTFIDTV